MAVIEVSHWHAFHAPAYVRQLSAMPDVEIVALQDPDYRLATARAAEVGCPLVFTDYRAMLMQTKPDFVLALGRHSIMTEVALFLLAHRFPFIMEKPLGLNARQVATILEKVEATKVFAGVPLPQRQMPFFLRAKSLCAKARLGPLSHIYIRIIRETSARYKIWNSSWMLDPAVSGGGCLRNLGIHGFDFFLEMTGEAAHVTAAQMSARALGEPVEDYASVQMLSKSGVLGTLEVGNVFPSLSDSVLPKRLFSGGDVEWKISGRDGLFISKDGIVRLITDQGEEVMPEQPAFLHPSYRLLREMLERWQAGKPPTTGVADCYRAVQLVDAAYSTAGWPVAP